MFEKASIGFLAAVTLAAAPLTAQDDEGFAERERALARELAEQQESSAERERAFARELAEQQRAHDALLREQAAQQAEEQRNVVREYEAQQRELAVQQRQQAEQQAEQQRQLAREYEAQQREFAMEQESAARELARELAKARQELQASAAEIARLSAQRSGYAMSEVMRRVPQRERVVMLGQRPMLGINVEDAADGVRVRGVSPNGPAAAAGVAVGDTIVALNGVDLGRDDGTSAYVALMDDVEPGEDIKLRVRRGGMTRDVVVEATETTGSPVRVEWFGGGENVVTVPQGNFVSLLRGSNWSDVELVSLTPGLGEYFGSDVGLLVVRAGRMGELGLRDGDVILEIGSRAPQSPEHAMRIIASFEPGESVPLSIMRQRRRETLMITVPEEGRTGWNVIGRESFSRRYASR
jgi:C-terminal processing protease CtpA/Prc